MTEDNTSGNNAGTLVPCTHICTNHWIELNNRIGSLIITEGYTQAPNNQSHPSFPLRHPQDSRDHCSEPIIRSVDSCGHPFLHLVFCVTLSVSQQVLQIGLCCPVGLEASEKQNRHPRLDENQSALAHNGDQDVQTFLVNLTIFSLCWFENVVSSSNAVTQISLFHTV